MFDYQYCPLCKSNLGLGTDGYTACQNQDCTFTHYQNPTPVVAAIVEYGKDHVILAHNVKWPPKLFALITGFLEKHEHPDECVIREVKEELGLDAKIESFIGHYSFNRMNQLIIAYHVTATGKITLQEEELDDYRIVPFEKVRTWPAGTGHALRDFLRGRGYDPVEMPFPKK